MADRPFIWNCLRTIRSEIVTVKRYARNGLRLKLALRSIVNAALDVRTSVCLIASVIDLYSLYIYTSKQRYESQRCESQDISPHSRSSLYPLPVTVLMSTGRVGSASSFWRKVNTCTSTVRLYILLSYPQTARRSSPLGTVCPERSIK